MTKIATMLQDALKPKGVAVIIEGHAYVYTMREMCKRKNHTCQHHPWLVSLGTVTNGKKLQIL